MLAWQFRRKIELAGGLVPLQSFGAQLSNLCQRGGGVAGLKRAKQWRHEGEISPRSFIIILLNDFPPR